MSTKSRLYIRFNIIHRYNLRYGLSDLKLLELVHDKYNKLNYNEIILDSHYHAVTYDVFDGIIKW